MTREPTEKTPPAPQRPAVRHDYGRATGKPTLAQIERDRPRPPFLCRWI